MNKKSESLTTDYTPHTPAETEEMLRVIGKNSIDDLFQVIPEKYRYPEFALPMGVSEWELRSEIQKQAEKNLPVTRHLSFLGAGAYEHLIPTIVDYLSQRGEWVTPYTPYQAEASQGTLQAIFEFQSLIAELTAMEVVNGSLYEGATALAEAMMLAHRETGRKRFLIAGTVHPQYREVARTYFGKEFPQTAADRFILQEIPPLDGMVDYDLLEQELREDVAAVVFQYPNFFGILEDYSRIVEPAHQKGALVITVANPLSLGILNPPGAWGADIVVGEGQPLGLNLNYGGPYLGIFATRKKYLRKIPGRLVSMTKDRNGQRGFVLTLQTREQHIRREQATSNICTNSSLQALRATIFLAYWGKQGLVEVARRNLLLSHYAAQLIGKIPGVRLEFPAAPFFNEFVFSTPLAAGELRTCLSKEGIDPGFPLAKYFPGLPNSILCCVTETKSGEQIELFQQKLAAILT